MYVLLVTLKPKPEKVKDFIAASLDDAKGSIGNEPGCLRFDVLQDEKDPNTVYFYEVYKDKAAFEAHGKMPHFIKWRDTVKDWYVTPPTVGFANSIFPKDNAWVKQK